MNGGPQSNVLTSFQDFMTDLFYFPLLFVFDDLLFFLLVYNYRNCKTNGSAKSVGFFVEFVAEQCRR